MLKFGDVFRYRGKEYVYLAKTEEVWYTAQILDKKKTEILERFYENKSRTSKNGSRLLNMPVYCFVILITIPFNGRAAHLGKTDKNDATNACNTSEYEYIGVLNQEDSQEIITEIKKGPVPLQLKELTKDIFK